MPLKNAALLVVILLLGVPNTVVATVECADCHGKDGASTDSDVPTIGGLSEQYLVDSMAAYRDNKRPCPKTRWRGGDKKRPRTDMCEIAVKLGAEGVAKVASELSAMPFVKAMQPFDGSKAAVGKRIHATQCEKCHSEGGSVADDEAGLLAGQWMPYLKETFAQFTTGARPQAEKMKVKFNALKPADQEALLHYYASQQ